MRIHPLRETSEGSEKVRVHPRLAACAVGELHPEEARVFGHRIHGEFNMGQVVRRRVGPVDGIDALPITWMRRTGEQSRWNTPSSMKQPWISGPVEA